MRWVSKSEGLVEFKDSDGYEYDYGRICFIKYPHARRVHCLPKILR